MLYTGLIIGLYTFLMVGVLHVGVVKIEEKLGSNLWPGFVVLGIIFGVWSLFAVNELYSGILGVSAFLFAWPGPELRKQKERVAGRH